MSESGPPPLGPRLQRLRKDRRLTLEDLARLSGVSRSMLSQIERGQANPTVATVWALGEALHIGVAELLGAGQGRQSPRIDISAASSTPEMRSDDGRCVLKILSPADRVGQVEWYELRMEPGGTLRSAPHARGSTEHLTVLEGRLLLEAGEEHSEVEAGATARYLADIPHCISNPGENAVLAILVNLFK